MNAFFLQVTLILGASLLLDTTFAASIGVDNDLSDFADIQFNADYGRTSKSDNFAAEMSKFLLDSNGKPVPRYETDYTNRGTLVSSFDGNLEAIQQINQMEKDDSPKNTLLFDTEVNKMLENKINYDVLQDDLKSAVYHDTSYDSKKNHFDVLEMWRVSRVFLLIFLIFLIVGRLILVCRYYHANKKLNKTDTVHLGMPKCEVIQSNCSPVYQKLSEDLNGPKTPIFNRHEFNKSANNIF